MESMVFPPSLLSTASAAEFKLAPKHAFYRVVAIDAKGNRSGASDYVAGPRPYIYSSPATDARIGAPYRYEAKTVASIGDLTNRDPGGGEPLQAAFWDADQAKFSLGGFPRASWVVPPEFTLYHAMPLRSPYRAAADPARAAYSPA
jgi:hypothetical protein